MDVIIKTKCSDYKQGEDIDSCDEIRLSDDKKHCVFTNNECKESYKQCGDYTGKDALVCNSIITENSGKWVYDNGCKDKTMQCSEYTILWYYLKWILILLYHKKIIITLKMIIKELRLEIFS